MRGAHFLITWGRQLRWFFLLLLERMPMIYTMNEKRRREQNCKNRKTKQKGRRSCIFHSAIFRHSVTRHSTSFCSRLGSISLAAVRETSPRSSPSLLGDDRESSGSQAQRKMEWQAQTIHSFCTQKTTKVTPTIFNVTSSAAFGRASQSGWHTFCCSLPRYQYLR